MTLCFGSDVASLMGQANPPPECSNRRTVRMKNPSEGAIGPPTGSSGAGIRKLTLSAETIKVLSDKTSNGSSRDDCDYDTGCNCNIWWSYWTYYWDCCGAVPPG
jgi:hypothetical protein